MRGFFKYALIAAALCGWAGCGLASSAWAETSLTKTQRLIEESEAKYLSNQWHDFGGTKDINIRLLDPEVSPTTQILATTIMSGVTIDHLKSVILDADNFCAWVGYCLEAQDLPATDTQYRYRLVLKSPTFYKDRVVINDVIVVEQAPDSLHYVIGHTAPVNSEESAGVIMPVSNGFWRFEKIDGEQIKVALYFDIDAGGGVHRWGVDRYVKKVAIKTLEGLKLYCQSSQ